MARRSLNLQTEPTDTSPSASPWGAVRRRRDTQFPEKREALLAAAAELFRERGYEGASLNDLADRLNITKPTLYYYVRSKDELVREIIARAQEEMLRDMRATELGKGTAYEKLRAIMINFVMVVTSDYGACLSMIGNRHFDEATRKEIQARVQEADQILHRIFAAGQKDGSLKIADRVLTLHALFGALNWLPRWYKVTGKLPREKFAKQFTDILLNGVRGSAEPKPQRRLPQS